MNIWGDGMRYRRFYNRRKVFAFKALCVLISLCIAVLLIDARLRPAIRELAVIEAHAAAAGIVNRAVEKLLLEKGPEYSELVTLTCAENGAITAITSNIVPLNLFKAQVTNAIDKEFEETGKTVVKVPLGSATGITLFSGEGPTVSVSVSYSSSTESEFENSFTAVGMNQTQHRIMLNVTSNVLMTLSGGRVASSVTTSFCVAQTVIVGTVPDIVFN